MILFNQFFLESQEDNKKDTSPSEKKIYNLGGEFVSELDLSTSDIADIKINDQNVVTYIKLYGSEIKYNDQGNKIYEKLPNGKEVKYNDQGNKIYEKHPDGSEIKYNDQGQMIYGKHPNGYETKYNDQGVKIYEKHPNGYEIKYNDQGLPIYEKHSSGYEYKYNDQGVKIYEKHPDGRETESTYNDEGKLIKVKHPDGTIIKFNDQGKKIYEKHPDGSEIKFNDQGYRIYKKIRNGDEYFFDTYGNLVKEVIKPKKKDEYGELTKQREVAIKKAENYMRDYHGMFLHAFMRHQLNGALNISQNAEICVSTVRSNTTFQPEENSLIFIGFGNIRELYDFDAYSEVVGGLGFRRSTQDVNQGPELNYIRKLENLKAHHNEFNENNYYDEGFMKLFDAEVLIASVPFFNDRFDIIKQIKSKYPHIKIIKPEEFGKLKKSEDLLKILYKLRDEKRDKELMSRPFEKFEENKTYSFKEYYLIESKVQIPLNVAYEIFKKEYINSTGKSWNYNKFLDRARNWEFYGDENGYVAIRNQKSGFVKLVGMAGNNKSKLKGINDLTQMKLPLWGLVSKEIKDIAIRKGMREPTQEEKDLLKSNISSTVFGDAEILEFTTDGGIKLKYPDVGVVIKYMVGTPEYFVKLRMFI
jgi:YD repeat-containing protein